MSNERLKPSFTLDEDRIKELKKVVPEAFADNQINWETLKEALGEYLEEEEVDDEHFGLFWPGKREARKIASIPSKGTLVPAPGEGINEENTGNIFIEGENLEVLKLLQKSYAGKIKMIYIDPPYNTGNDFVYDDDFKEPIDEYLRRTGQVDDEGKPQTTNKKADGRFHSKWLSMMYPRLRLARNLLTDDGAIFISIDDNELTNIRKLCDELFGEESFIGQVTVLCNPKGRSQDKFFATCHEYLLVYSKSLMSKGSFNVLKTAKEIESDYPYKNEKGVYRVLELRNTHREFGKHNRPNLYYPFYVNIDGQVSLNKSQSAIKVLPVWDDGFDGCWTWGKNKALNEIDDLVGKQVNGKWKIYRQAYGSAQGEKPTKQLKSIWAEKIYHTEKGQSAFNKLFAVKTKLFQSPKSLDVIKNALKMHNDVDSIVLDFYSGSSTTAHAVMDYNVEENYNRKFIMVQLPEQCNELSEPYEVGYKTIAEIGKERIRRVITKIKEDEDVEKNEKNKLGFKVFKLQKSNYKEWEDFDGTNVKQLEAAFGDHESPLVDGWKEENLLTEILLMEGYPLDSKIEEEKQYKKNKIKSVSSDFCDHKLWICLDEKVEKETIDIIGIDENDIFICLDSAITDENKARLMDKGILKTI